LQSTFRTQLQGTNVRIVEIAPPAVGTDLHREREDPDDNKKHKNPNALTVEEFMDEITKKLENGDEMISAGMGDEIVEKWHGTMGAMYAKITSK
jgi:short-subunit dehydrogenase involved in D-alanine esterification of teichoic acids